MSRPTLRLPIKEQPVSQQVKKTKPEPKPQVPKFREFTFFDGERSITVNRRAVLWFCPYKSDPENGTMVGLIAGLKAIPLRVTYKEFAEWATPQRVKEI